MSVPLGCPDNRNVDYALAPRRPCCAAPPGPTGDPRYGCTDPRAMNFSASATMDDGSCVCGPPPPGDCEPIRPAFKWYQYGAGIHCESVSQEDAEDGIIEWSWNFGDGNADSGPVVFHFYDEAGTWPLTLLVRTVSGQTRSVTGSVTVILPAPVIGGTLPWVLVFALTPPGGGAFCLPPPTLEPVLGCTNPAALNYHPAATVNDGSCIFSHDYQGDFALMLVLDQTGSIGQGGASRGVAIIDYYGSALKAIGWVSFGDILCQQKAPTTNVAAARAELLNAATATPSPAPFFQDSGGDIPENGVDALAAANALMRAATLPGGTNRYLHLVTDTDAFAHNVTPAASVLPVLTDGFYAKVFLESASDADAPGQDDGENDQTGYTPPSPNSVDGSNRIYRQRFPAGSIIVHRDYVSPF